MNLDGRFADASRTLGTDPRVDPRVVAAMRPFGLDDHTEPSALTAASPREDQLAFIRGAEIGFQALTAAWVQGAEPAKDVVRETRTIRGVDGNQITLYLHRTSVSDGPTPCVVHLHGGGMALLTAADESYVHLRDSLAASGLTVIGVEFRNAGGILGDHPFPAGLNDCVSATRWAAAHLGDLDASHVVVAGESGGGNLTLATAIKAKREGWINEIAGVYAQCPFVSNAYTELPEDLPSLRENDSYFIDCALLAVLAEAYDPGSGNADDPICWPLRATLDDLKGLPPHVISVNELDPLRDEGLAMYRKLCAAGVSTMGRLVAGTPHGGDLLLPAALPDVYAASVRDLSGFARAVGH